MKLASYEIDGRASYGVVVQGGVVDAGRRIGDRLPTLRAAIAAGAMDELRRLTGQAPDAALDAITLLPPITDAAKILAVGLNYAAHIREGGRDMPEYPTLFTRFNDAQVGQGQPLVRPLVSEKFDFEGELAFVIGKAGRHVKAADAFDHVAGYSCFNDGSVRDWQRHTIQFTAGKNFYRSGAFGPWLVTTDEIADPSKLSIATRLNGKEMQASPIDDLVFDVPRLVEYISTFTPLIPGDVVATGTPGGVGFFRKPPVFMKPGDVIEIEISGIGTLSNPIVDE